MKRLKSLMVASSVGSVLSKGRTGMSNEAMKQALKWHMHGPNGGGGGGGGGGWLEVILSLYMVIGDTILKVL